MQLKTVGESLTVTKTINNVLNLMPDLESACLENDIITDNLAVAVKNYSMEAVKAAISQSTLNFEQIKAILTEKGLKDEVLETTTAELAQITATNRLNASQSGTTSSTLGLSYALKALGTSIKNTAASMWTFISTNPIGMILGITAAIGGTYLAVTKIHNAVTTSLDKQKEKLNAAKTSYEDLTSGLQKIESEIQNADNAIKELQNTPNLSWADQNELERLREITKELKLQKTLKQQEQLDAAQNLYKENKATFEKEFKSSSGDAQISDLKQKLTSGDIGITQLDLSGNITDMAAALQYLNEEKEKATDENEIAEYDSYIEEITASIKKNGKDYLSSISSYKQNILALADIREDKKLTEDEQAFYDYLSSFQKTIYEAYSPAAWNNMQINSIFDRKDMEATKEELISMAKAGTLDENTLKGYTNLYHALENTDFILKDGETAISAFIAELISLSEKESSLSFDFGLKSFSEILAGSKELLDAYQSNVNTIGTALDSLSGNALSASEALDLLQSITEIDSTFDLEAYKNADDTYDYERALQALLDTITNKAANKMPEFAGYIRNIGNEAKASAQGITDLSTAISNMQSAEKLLQSVQNSITENKGAITPDILNDIVSKYPKLEGAVASYNAELITSQELYHELQKCYETDWENFQISNQAKIYQNNAYYNAILENESDRIKELAASYAVDLKNYKSLAEAKAAIESRLLSELGNSWSKYYDIVLGKDGIYKTDAKFNEDSYDAQNDPERIAIMNKADELERFYKKLADTFDIDKVRFHDIQLNFRKSALSSVSSGKTEKEESEPDIAVFNWIDTQLQRTDEAIDHLQAKLESASEYTSQNKTIDQLTASFEKENDLLEKAKEEYRKKAEAVGLSAVYMDKIQNGLLSIEELDENTDEAIIKKINEYQEWYEKTIDLDKKLQDNTASIKELNRQKLDNIINDYERVASLAETYKDYQQALIDVKEAKGENISESDYNSLIQKELNLQATLCEQYQKMEEQFKLSGLTPNDDEWYEHKKELVSLQTQIEDCTVSVEELKDAVLEVRWANFEKGLDALSALYDEISDVSALLGSGETFKDGEMTDSGITKLGLYMQQYVSAKQQIAEYHNAIKALGNMYKNGSYSLREYNEKLEEFQAAQRNAALSSNEAKQAVLEFNRQAIEAQIDAMKELIDAKKKALDAEKDLNEYQKSISEKQTSIQSLEKKLTALSLSDAREDRAIRLELEEQLAKEKEALADMQREHSIEEQKNALDKEYENYEKEKKDELNELESNLEKQNEVMEEYLGKVQDNYTIIYKTLNTISNEFGITFTDSLTSPWENAANAAKLYEQAVGEVFAQLSIDSSQLQDLTGTSMGSRWSGENTGQWVQDKNTGSSTYGKWWYKTSGSIDGNHTYSTGWEQIDDKWYYFGDDGWMKSSEWIQSENGKWYYVDHNGEMAADSYVQDGNTGKYYWVESDGAWDGKESILPNDLKNYKVAYAKGTLSNPKSQMALTDEYGDELIIHAGTHGNLTYLTKGTGVIPADLTERLMNLAYHPSALLNKIPDIGLLKDAAFADRIPEQSVNVNVNTPLIHVEGGLDTAMLAKMQQMCDRLPNEIAMNIKRSGIR